MDAWLQALLLGIIQGLTEFLPVSSSGHLVLAQSIMGESFEFQDMAVAFDLVLHIGTLLPVLYFYRKDLEQIWYAYTDTESLQSVGLGEWLRGNESRWLLIAVIVGTIPTAVVGLLFKDTFEVFFHSVPAVCGAMLCTAILLFATRLAMPLSSHRQLGLLLILSIGIGQGLAITPGISRSGTTIAIALLLGLERDLAARFSFMLSIPAITGAAILVAKDGVQVPAGGSVALIVGFIAAMVVGYAALVMLVALVKRGGLHNFAYYLLAVATLGLLWPSA
ncbi:MAG: undecaprenyl-diphosphate phosphatase [Myxococcales bacterium]|nr:undecaprenyl-diphosphate phosphatase [Myxococcales bacterium]